MAGPAALAADSGPILYLGSGFSVAGEQNTKVDDATQPPPPVNNPALGGPDFDFQYQDAALAEVGLGYRLMRYLRVEADVAYHGHTLQNVKYRPGRGDVHWIAGMFNVYGDYPLGGGDGADALPIAVPYVGAGVGVLWSKAKVELQIPDRKVRGESAEFAWNVMLGTAIPISRWVSLDVGYRYLESLDHQWMVKNGATGVGDVDAEYQTHEGRLGLRIGF